VFDTRTPGLGVRAYRVVEETRDGTKKQAIARSFIVQWTDKATGRKQREPLGAWGSLTVEQAREAARIRLGRLAAGFDPAAERAARFAADAAARAEAARAKVEAAFNLDTLIADWARVHLASRSPRYATEAQRALKVAFKPHLTKPAAALAHGDVTAVLDNMAADGHAPIASRTQAYGRACYGWAVERRRLASNPFADLPVIAGGAPARDRVLTDDEIGAIWRAADGLGEPFRPVVRLLLMTAQRREEIAGMCWSEVSADLSTWTLPAARAKNDRAHVVHLSAPARAILAGMKWIDGQDLIFSTTGKTAPSGFSKAKASLDTAMAKAAALGAGESLAGSAAPAGLSPRKRGKGAVEAPMATGWRFHDFRRTAVTWLAGAGFPPHVADRLLNHVSGSISGVAAVYQRGEFLTERRAALDAWAAHVLACAEGGEAAGNVVRLARR
jgi:integrase